MQDTLWWEVDGWLINQSDRTNSIARALERNKTSAGKNPFQLDEGLENLYSDDELSNRTASVYPLALPYQHTNAWDKPFMSLTREDLDERYHFQFFKDLEAKLTKGRKRTFKKHKKIFRIGGDPEYDAWELEYKKSHPFAMLNETEKLAMRQRFLESAPGYMNASQKIAIAKRSNWQSVISGETSGLVITDIQQVGPDGKPVTVDQVLLTQDEKAEQEHALRADLNLPDRIFSQNEQWGKISEDYFTQKKLIEEAQLDKSGHIINEAQKQQKKYNLLKRTNLRYFDIEIRKLQVAINKLEKFDRREISEGKPRDMRNAKSAELVLSKYYARLAELQALRAKEKAKTFTLPNQVTDLSRFHPMDIGNYDALSVRPGSGPELLHPGAIVNAVRLEELAGEYQFAVGDIRMGNSMPGSLEDYGVPEEEIRKMTREMLDDWLSRGLEN